MKTTLFKLIITLFALSTHTGIHAQNIGKPSLPVLRAGSAIMTGVFLSADGYIAAPAIAEPGAEWNVIFEGETYPAKIVVSKPQHGLVILKTSRQKPFPAVALERGIAPLTAKLALYGLDAAGTEKEIPVNLIRARRLGVTEQRLDGSFYELSVTEDAPLDGALLMDATPGKETGKLYGLLIGAKGERGERYALFGFNVLVSAAEKNLPLGNITAPTGPIITFADGSAHPLEIRPLEFKTSLTDRNVSHRARAVQDWRDNTGWWQNSLTSPRVSDGFCYFGATNGLLYSVNLKTMQREWFAANEYPLFFPPSVGADVLCVGTGNLNLIPLKRRDNTLKEVIESFGRNTLGINLGIFEGMFTFKRTVQVLLDRGQIVCVDRKSGATRWTYDTRFITQPLLVGDKVVYGGMETLGVLDLATGKPIWDRESNRKSAHPVFYTIAGARDDRMFALANPSDLTGGSGRKDPIRLQQSNRPLRVECYTLFKGDFNEKKREKKPLWSTEIKFAKPGKRKPARPLPALSSTLVYSEETNTCYGATSHHAFAVDAASGKILWQTPDVFEKHFGGHLFYSDSLLFATTSDNRLVALNAQDGQIVWTFAQSQLPLSVPLVKDGVVYVGSLDTHLYALDIRKGTLLWKVETGGKICGQPCVVGSKLYTMSDDGKLSEIDLQKDIKQ